MTPEELKITTDNAALGEALFKHLESLGYVLSPFTDVGRLVDGILIERRSNLKGGDYTPGAKIYVEVRGGSDLRRVSYLLKSKEDIPKVAKRVLKRIQFLKDKGEGEVRVKKGYFSSIHKGK